MISFLNPFKEDKSLLKQAKGGRMKKKKPLPRISFERFLNYGEVTEILKAMADARPDFCRLESLGVSRQGRQLHLLAITDFESGAPEDKPAYLIHGNIHASELAGTHAALYTARQLLSDVPEVLRRVVFYIVPRLNPDGAEFVVKTGGKVRSRSDEEEKLPNTLYQQDIDGNGLILNMRQKHPDGTFIKDPRDSRLMVRRKFDSKGPFYRLLPEGMIYEWDGGGNIRTGGRTFDWNRNWSYDWRPEPEQAGSGDFPFSEPEMRCMGEFMHARQNLFGVLGYHTGPAAVLRPPSTGKDTDMDESDVLMMEKLAQIGSRETGFPVIPVVKYHNKNRRDINLRGHFHNFGYYHLGLFVFEFELGTIHDSAGISTEERLAAVKEEETEDLMRRLMAWWDKRKKKEPLFTGWKRFEHPQLGSVEVGGFLNSRLSNPSLRDLEKIVRGTYRFTLEHARRHPHIRLEDLSMDRFSGDICRIRARIANRGDLPTNVTARGRELERLKTVQAVFYPAEDVALLSLRPQFDTGHMAGGNSCMLEWFVSAGKGHLGEIRVRGGTGGNLRVPLQLD